MLKRYTSPDAVVILTTDITLPDDIDDKMREFYAPLCESFERAVSERLYKSALAAYEASTDRRKRYRYVPWRASLSLTRCGKGEYQFLIKTKDGINLNERHTWKDGVLVKREKTKRS